MYISSDRAGYKVSKRTLKNVSIIYVYMNKYKQIQTTDTRVRCACLYTYLGQHENDMGKKCINFVTLQSPAPLAYTTSCPPSYIDIYMCVFVCDINYNIVIYDARTLPGPP